MLDPARCHHIIEDNQLVGWRYTGLGRNAQLASQVFLPEEVWFEKLPNPFDVWRGMPPLYVAESAAKADFAASAFMRGIIENNADSGLIVRSDQLLSEDQREQVKSTLRDRKRKAGTPIKQPKAVATKAPAESDTINGTPLTQSARVTNAPRPKYAAWPRLIWPA